MNGHNVKSLVRTTVQLLVFFFLVPFLPLLVSRHWDWWEAWAFALVCICGFLLSRMVVAKYNPDLIAERARFTGHTDIKSWDRVLAPLVGLGSVLIPLAAGLEMLYGRTTDFGMPVKVLAFIMIAGGYALGSYALYANRFFSGVVRIQSDRGHRVISAGPYRWVRHPGYAGALAASAAIPFFLDSYWAFAPLLLWAIVLFIRTSLEDRTLQDELEGYRDYAQRVRYRLVPGIW